MATPSVNELITLTVGMFGAAPGASVLTELDNQAKAGSSLTQIAENLAASSAFTGIYPTFLTNAQFTTDFVGSLFSETSAAVQLELVALATSLLNSGTSRGALVVMAINALAGVPEADTTYGNSAAKLSNQVEVANDYTVINKLSGGSLADLQGVISSVTSTQASVDAALLAIDGTVNAGTPFTLTTGVNSFTGSALNDTFNATALTFTAGDVLNGGAGTDTLSIVDNVAGMASAAPGHTLTSVEKAVISTNGGLGQATVNASSGSPAVKQVLTIAPTVVTPGSTNTIAVTYGGVTVTTAALDGTATAAEVNAAIAAAINAIAGSTVATVVGAQTVVTAPTAGVALPTITTVVNTTPGDVTFTQATAQANAAAVDPVTGVTAAAYDLSGDSSLTDITVTAAGAVNLKASATANVDATTTSGIITVNGGLTQDIVAKGGFVVGGGKGAITVTDSAQGAIASTVDGGTSVVINSTSKAAGATTGTITVGAAGATTKPTGDVTITSAIVEAKSVTDTAGGAIAVTGGADVVITQSATKALMTTDATVNGTITNAPVTVTGASTTTSVTAKATAAVTAVNTVLAVDAVTEVTTATFGTLVNSGTIVVNGLTFTNTSGATLTVAQSAAAFANLTAGATQGSSTKGTYSGTFAGFTSGVVGGTSIAPTVTFTGSTAAAKTNLIDGGTGAAAFALVTDGVTAVKATGTTGVTANSVTITDVNNASATKAGTITAVTAQNYTTLAVNSNALSTLNVLGGSSNITIGNGSLTGNTAKTLNLAVDGISGGILADANVYTTINVATAYTGTSTTTTSSTLTNISSSSVDDLNVSGDKVLVLASTAGMTGVINVKVSGSAGLTGTFAQATQKTFNTSETTGKSTITMDATKATYTGGAGVDNVTTSLAAPTKAISLGAGNDKLTLASGTVSTTAALTGGDGTDTLSMVAADIVVADNDLAFSALVTGFEALEITGTVGPQTINLTNMTITDNITVAAGTGTLTLDKIVDAGQLTLTGAIGGVTLTNSAFTLPTTDSMNVTMTAAAGFDGGTVTAANIETINLTATDTVTSTGITVHTLILAADKATTVKVSGNAGVDLSLAGSTKVATLDASDATGVVTVTSDSTAAITIKGGSAADVLTSKGASTTADTLIGGAGADTLTTNAGLTSLTGGSGLDLFVIGTAGASGAVYSSIKDAEAGDRIQLINTGVETFTTAKVTLAGTASFSDYLNTATDSVTGHTNAVISWFQYGANTYIVEDRAASADFVNGTDVVVELVGLIDLSTASLSYGGTAAPILMIG